MRSRAACALRVALAVGAAIALAVVLLGVAVIALVRARADARSRDAALRAGATQVAQLSASAPALLTAPGALDGRVGEPAPARRGGRPPRAHRRALGLARRRACSARGREIADAIASGRAALRDDAARRRAAAALRAPRCRASARGPAAGGAVLVATATAADERTAAAHPRRSCCWRAARRGAARVAIALRSPGAALAPAEAPHRGRARRSSATGDPTRRLPPAGPRDEVGALAETLNAMLAALERAREAERRFLADASHELRTPLTALRGNVDYLARHGAERRGDRRPRGGRRAPRAPGRRPARARARGRGRRRRAASSCGWTSSRARARARASRSMRPRRSPCAATPTRSRARSTTSSTTRSRHGRRAGSRQRRRAARRRVARLAVADEGAGPGPARRRARLRALLARRPPTRPRLRASGWRSCARPPSATAASVDGRTAPRSRSTCRSRLSSQRALRHRRTHRCVALQGAAP